MVAARTSVRLAVALIASGILAASVARAATLDPLLNRAHVLYHDIYDKAAWAARVPYELAKPLLIRAQLKSWLRKLELEDPVRRRVSARIRSAVLVDEIVPFLLAVKDTYAATDGAVASFDVFLRERFSPAQAIPGMEHSLFAWKPATDDEPKGGGFRLDVDLAGQIVTLYDALYLAEVDPDADLGEEIASCRRRTQRDELRAAVERTSPAVRGLIEQVRMRLELDADVKNAVDAVLSDPKRLETVTASGIEFLDQLVCKSYRMFATQLVREEQLRRWLLAEFEKPDGGALWSYLEHANLHRRYAVLVVVDGLQGHLVEALAGGSARDPFIRAIHAEHDRADAFAPATQRSVPAPTQQLQFLRAFSERGFRSEGYLAFFRDLYRDSGTGDPRRPYGIVRGGIATTPTISVRNLPIVKTGAPVAGPGSTGIPNFHFVDRTYTRAGEQTGRPYYFFGNDALRLTSLTRESGMRSLFDRLPNLSSFSCAAQYDDAAHYSIDAFINLALGGMRRDFAEVLCATELRERARNERRLQELRSKLLADRHRLTRVLPFWRLIAWSERRDRRILAERVLAEIAELEQRTLPELLLYYNPWPDHFAHFNGPFSDAILAPSGELNRLDYWLARFAAAYREGGVEARTLFGMAGDHGLTPVFHLLNPEVEVFDVLREQGIDFRIAKISSDEGEGPKLNSLFEPPVMKGYDAIVASTAGGNFMLDFFLDQSDHWDEQPLHRELVALKLIPKGTGAALEVDVIEALLSRLHESLDYLAVREESCGPDGGVVRLIGMRGGERADGWIERVGERIHYRYRGADLLDTDRLMIYEDLTPAQRALHARLRSRCLEEADVKVPSTWCTEKLWRGLARLTPRPDSVVQLAHLYDTDRAGTVNLFPREGIGYNSLVAGRHAGEFFHEKDAFVGLWGAPVTRAGSQGRVQHAVNGSVPITIFEFLVGAPVAPEATGWGYPSLAPELFPEVPPK